MIAWFYSQAEILTWASVLTVLGAMFALEMIRTLAFQGSLTLAHQRSSFLQRKRIYRIPWKDSQILSEVFSTLQIIPFDALFVTGFLFFGFFRSTDGYSLSTFLITFVWFEIWFYFSHRLFHTKRFFFIHAQHHTAKVTSPWTAMSFSLLERTILLIGGFAVPALLSWLMPLSVTGFGLYFLVNYALNLYGHLNVELIPSSWLQKPGGQILNSTTYHALHHSRFQGHYGLFTPFLDRWFHTRFSDYEIVQREAYEERGLETLNQRFNTEKGR